MPDITMCWGRDCPVKENCYRFMAKPDDYQAYFIDSPIRKGKCQHYWAIDKTFKRKSLWKRAIKSTLDDNIPL